MKKLLLLFLFAISMIGCSVPQSSKPTVLIFGDSLTVESEQAAINADPRENLVFQAAGGTAMCDYANGAAEDRLIFHPKRVVLAFTGNVSNCVLPGYRAGKLAGVVANYQSSLKTFYAAFQGLPVTVIAPPAMVNPGIPAWFPYNGDPALLSMYQTVCAQLGMRYSTVADDFLSPEHIFRDQAIPFQGGPEVPIRTSDGIHLTAAGEVYYGVALIS